MIQTAPHLQPGKFSVDRDLLKQRLLSVEIGETVTYDDLAAVIGAPCRPGTTHYSRLSSARVKAEREGAAFENVPNVGYRRCANHERSRVVGGHIRRAARHSRRGVVIHSHTDVASLTPAQQIERATQLTVATVMSTIGSRRMQKKIQATVSPDSDQAPGGKALLEFLRKRGSN